MRVLRRALAPPPLNDACQSGRGDPQPRYNQPSGPLCDHDRVRHTDCDSLARRLEILRLPVVTLSRMRHPRPRRTDVPGEWEASPCATGVGPGDELLQLYRGYSGSSGSALIARSSDGADAAVTTVLRDIPDGVGTPQPMPDGAILLTYVTDDGSRAGVWNSEGRQVATGDLGRARRQVLTTPTGRVWVAYFDEAIGGPGPCVLARFGPDLVEQWRYDLHTMPAAIDCYALNVDGETATAYDDDCGLTQVAATAGDASARCRSAAGET